MTRRVDGGWIAAVRRLSPVLGAPPAPPETGAPAKRRNAMTKTFTAALSLALLGTAAVAQAQSAEVRYGDLNLSSPAGRAELERRTEGAARRVCKDEPPIGSRVSDRAETSRCKDQVRAQVSAALPH
jgi:UrcA family protein